MSTLDTTSSMGDMDIDTPGDQLLLDDADAPIEVTFHAPWERVEQALAAAGIAHDPIRYQLKENSIGVLALFIEVPVAGDPTPERLVDVERAISDSLRNIHGTRPFHIHFLDRATKVDQVA